MKGLKRLSFTLLWLTGRMLVVDDIEKSMLGEFAANNC